MTEEHPNISVLKQLDLRNLGEASDLLRKTSSGTTSIPSYRISRVTMPV